MIYENMKEISTYLSNVITRSMERINRVKEVLDIKGISQKNIVKKVCKNPNTIACIGKHKTQPYLKELKRIVAILDSGTRKLLAPTMSKS
jgi:hypothetical protein